MKTHPIEFSTLFTSSHFGILQPKADPHNLTKEMWDVGVTKLEPSPPPSTLKKTHSQKNLKKSGNFEKKEIMYLTPPSSHQPALRTIPAIMRRISMHAKHPFRHTGGPGGRVGTWRGGGIMIDQQNIPSGIPTDAAGGARGGGRGGGTWKGNYDRSENAHA